MLIIDNYPNFYVIFMCNSLWKIPPIFMKTKPTETNISKIKRLIDKDTHIQIRGIYLMIAPKTHDMYKKLLTLTDEENWEYYTYNPMISNTTKYCLKGLPVQTDEKDIQTAFSDKGIHITNVRQMTKSALVNETILHNPIPVWVLTTDNSNETRDKQLHLQSP